MKQNINRIDHVIWICKPENQARYVEQISRLCRVEFYGPVEKPDLGAIIYINWSAGIEVITPISDANPAAKQWFEHLEARGEGILGVVFGVADIEAGRKHAESLGYDVGGVIENTGDEPYADEMEAMKEIVIGNIINSVFVFGEIKRADNMLK